MKRITKIATPILAAAVMAVSCGDANNRVSMNTKVLTQAERDAMTPACVIEILKKGNQEFANNQLTVRNNTDLVADAAGGQFPMAVILSCLDSRVPVEDVFHRAIGDIFVGRVAGNTATVDMLGSMEFACAVAGAKVVMVLGHGACGAVLHAINNSQAGNITEMLSKIRPAVGTTEFETDGLSLDHIPNDFLRTVTLENIRLQVRNIRQNSEILRDMEAQGAIRIIGGYYDMHTGKVEFFENI